MIVDWCVGLLDCLFGVEVMELMYVDDFPHAKEGVLIGNECCRIFRHRENAIYVYICSL